MKPQSDVIIVGAGLSGLYTALNLPETMQVVILSAYEDNSSLAQGGVATCINPADTFTNHISDTLKAGHYINDISAVAHLVTGGPEQIEQLIQLGVPFDTDEEGSIAATLEGGHSSRRILHVQGDQTGKGIMIALKEQLALRNNITKIDNCQLLSLIKHHDTVSGVVYLKNGQTFQLIAAHTVLATGGLGDLYAQTTNHSGAIGIGIALAHQSGALCADMQYIQFHPTAFYEQAENHRFLISEALRGEGAYLLDEHEHRFMQDYDERLELAPRDIVSKAIHNVLSNQTNAYVYLDTRHIDKAFLQKRFPGIHKHLSDRGIELGKDLIPVTPVAHYTIGGIVVDKAGHTSLKGLYACGEATSSGVHGANRLASNSLLECLVYGRAIAEDITTHPLISFATDLIAHPIPLVSDFIDSGIESTMVTYIQETMTNKVGILRDSKELMDVQHDFTELLKRYEGSRYHDWSSFYLYNMLYTSIMVVNGAINSPSLGCHTIDETTDSVQLTDPDYRRNYL